MIKCKRERFKLRVNNIKMKFFKKRGGVRVFGKGISCHDCLQYAGKLSDGKPMCMKYGPLIDITCCRKFQKQKICPVSKDEKENAQADSRRAGNKCVHCRYFKEKKRARVPSSGECMKFPGRIFRGEERIACSLFENYGSFDFPVSVTTKS